MASRAHLLAGLRTGGPRSTSPFEGDGSDQTQEGKFANSGSPPASLGRATLKADAAPFTPGSRASPPASKKSIGVDGQASAIRMQQAISAAASMQHQASPSEGQGQYDFAAMYGASQGQPQQQQSDYQQQEMAKLIRQRQAQMVQNQLLAQQQQQQQQQEMEMYRLQAANQQQQHLQQVAVQQRLLLAQMQAEYNQQQQQHLQKNEHIFSAQDQRMAAQASIQASLRQRQAEQLYAQLMEQQQQAQQGEESLQLQQQQLLQRLQYLQLQAAANTQMQQGMQEYEDVPSMQQSNRRNGSTPRSDSPNSAAKEQNRRDRQASHTAADNATSWRSTSVSLSKAGRSHSQREGTPSIVVDDSASEKSDGGSAGGFGSDNETPETSEEDVGSSLSVQAKAAGHQQQQQQLLRIGGLNLERRTPSSLSSTTTNIMPRPVSLSQAPRSRAFTSEAKMTIPANGSNNGGAAAANGASRQPRGPPTEFHSINFTSRLSARTRREAMSKLCASPRAASFSTAPRPVVIA